MRGGGRMDPRRVGVRISVLRGPRGVASLVLAGSPASMPQTAREVARLRAALPDPDDFDQFARRHICRVDPWPAHVQRSFDEWNQQVRSALNGPEPWTFTGPMGSWDVTGRLGEIDVPTLVTSGRHDECTPALSEEVHRGIRGSEWVLFEDSSHMPFVEERERYMRVVGDFLARVESRI